MIIVINIFLTQQFQNDVPNSYERFKVTQNFKQICSLRNMVIPQGNLKPFSPAGHDCSPQDMMSPQCNFKPFLPRGNGCSWGPTMCLGNKFV